MALAENLVQEGVDRFRGVVGSLEGEFERVQRGLTARRKSLERQLNSRRRGIERRTRKLRDDLESTTLVKRALNLRSGAWSQVEERIGGLLSAFQIASKSDLTRIDRKLAQLNRRLKELEQTRKTNGGIPGSEQAL